MSKVKVLDQEIRLSTHEDEDYINITDIARYKDSKRTDYIIQNWLRNRNTIELLGIWESSIIQILIPSNSMGLESRLV